MGLKKQFLKSKPECKVTFELGSDAVEGVKTVHLVGDFNSWDESSMPMKKQKDGTYKISLNLAVEGQYQFRYLLDGERWENDWEADEYITSPFPGIENSVVYT